ncbi:MAG: RNA-guided endonuclease InsQ/TnpB family protein [Acidimicrobiales bacterium]
METRTVTCAAAPTPEQAEALKEVIQAFNAACNFVSALAWEKHCFNQIALHHFTYRDIRERFGLPSQLAVRAIAKVADAYKTNKAVRAEFRPLGAITYDSRVLRLLGVSNVSCSTLAGRITVKIFLGGYQRDRLAGAALGETKLVYAPEKDRFAFVFTVKTQAPPESDPEEFLGVDLGIKNIAADSDGTLYAGGKLRRLRKTARRVRRRIQKLGTRSARRLLLKRRRKEARRAKHVNHCISKQIVAAAKGTGRGVAVEDLTGIRSRITVRKEQRSEHSGWAFHQLRFFLEYKCADAGVPCVAVDPRNTSRTCPRCGCVDVRNRKSQSEFVCIHCTLQGHADVFGACEIALRATLSWPNDRESQVPSEGRRCTPRSSPAARGKSPRFSDGVA